MCCALVNWNRGVRQRHCDIFRMPRSGFRPLENKESSPLDARKMPDTNADDGSNLTTVRGQSIDVLALQAELTRLRGENAHLRAALAGTRDGATVAFLSDGGQTPQEPSEQTALSPRERVELFRRLFRGRTDTFPVRWHSATSGKSGYAPACSNEWVPGVCEKPRVKCTDCENRKFIALSDQVIFEHLTGKLTAGIYPHRTAQGLASKRCSRSVGARRTNHHMVVSGRVVTPGKGVTAVSVTRQCYTVVSECCSAKSLSGQGIQT